MDLYILRHGDAIPNATVHDSDRQLSELGQQQASAVGRFLRNAGTGIELILCSPLIRAQQTTAAVRQELGIVPQRTTEHLGPTSNPRHIIRQLTELANKSVLLVGHEPHLSAMISLLVAGGERGRVVMKPCSLAYLSVAAPVQPDRAVLQWLIHPEQMMKL